MWQKLSVLPMTVPVDITKTKRVVFGETIRTVQLPAVVIDRYGDTEVAIIIPKHPCGILPGVYHGDVAVLSQFDL